MSSGDRTAGLRRNYKQYKDIKSDVLTKFWHLGNYYRLILTTHKKTLLFKFEENGKIILVLPLTKVGVRKIKNYLNRIIDL